MNDTTKEAPGESSAPSGVTLELEVTDGTCRHCKAAAVFCEEHAGALVAQAFAEDSANRREAAAKAAERKLRAGTAQATRSDDARELRHVLVRWWGKDALSVAQEIVRILEAEK